MPPIQLLTNDKDFYGEITPSGYGKGDSNKLENSPPPPNPVSQVRLATDTQRKNNRVSFTDRLFENKGETPQPEGPSTIKELEKGTDLGSRITNFLTTPLVEVSEEDKKTQSKREVSRITGTEEKVENIIRPVGEIPIDYSNRAINYLENKGLQLLMVIGGIYILGSFVASPNFSMPKKSKKMED